MHHTNPESKIKEPDVSFSYTVVSYLLYQHDTTGYGNNVDKSIDLLQTPVLSGMRCHIDLCYRRDMKFVSSAYTKIDSVWRVQLPLNYILQSDHVKSAILYMEISWKTGGLTLPQNIFTPCSFSLIRCLAKSYFWCLIFIIEIGADQVGWHFTISILKCMFYKANIIFR